MTVRVSVSRTGTFGRLAFRSLGFASFTAEADHFVEDGVIRKPAGVGVPPGGGGPFCPQGDELVFNELAHNGRNLGMGDIGSSGRLWRYHERSSGRVYHSQGGLSEESNYLPSMTRSTKPVSTSPLMKL